MKLISVSVIPKVGLGMTRIEIIYLEVKTQPP
jgi:hypothetical protein